MKTNSIRAIIPYRFGTGWAFDDNTTGLVRELFVCGADLLCDQLSEGDDRFTLFFSESPFPGHTLHLSLVGQDGAGHTYDAMGKEVWLCPALLLYFAEAPPHIYAKAERFPVALRNHGSYRKQTTNK